MRLSHFFLLAFIFFSLIASQPITLFFPADKDALLEQLSAMPFFDKCKVLIDNSEIEQDFCQLSMMLETSITLEERAQALYLFSLTCRFSHVVCFYEKHESVSMLIFHFKLAQLFEKLTISGSLFNKERLKTWYPLSPNAIWNMQQHNYGKDKIIEHLQGEGYLKASLTDTIVENARNNITVDVLIAHGKKYTVKNVFVMANYPELLADDARELIKKIKKKAEHVLCGNYATRELFKEQLSVLKKILKRYGFFNASLSIELVNDDANATVDVHLSFTLYKKKLCEFMGNHFFPLSFLEDYIFNYGKNIFLFPREILGEDLIALYKEHGFLECTLTSYEENDRIIFCINENKRTVLTDITVDGCSFLSNEMIREKFFSGGLDTYVDKTSIKNKCDDLINHYRELGFWEARILDISYEVRALGEACVTIIVEEGPQRLFTSISCSEFEDNSIFTPKYYSTPKPLSLSIMQEDSAYIKKQLAQRGYVHSTVRPEFIGPLHNLAIVWSITAQKEEHVFGTTSIVGNQSIPAPIILSELSYRQGDVWNIKKVEVSLKRLRNLQTFESISLQCIDSDQSCKTMLLRYEEADKREIKVRAGGQLVGQNLDISTATYTVGGTLLYRNPFYKADRFECSVDISRFQRDFSLAYWRPSFFSWRLRTEYKVYSNRFDQPLTPFAKKYTLYKLAQDGVCVCFMYERDMYSFGVNLGFEGMAIQDIRRSFACDINFEPRLVDKYIPFFIAEPTFFCNTLDNDLYPSSGSYSLLSIKSMVPLDLPGALNIKFLGEYSWFFPVSSSVVALRLRAGHIVNGCFSQLIPSERFFLGGAFSLRAFDTDLVPPLTLVQCGTQKVPVAIGGKSMINMNAEWRFHVYRNIYGVLFLDCGKLAQDVFADIYLHPPATALGWGLRYHTTVGPVRFDIGWQLKEGCTWKNYAWFLTFGQIF